MYKQLKRGIEEGSAGVTKRAVASMYQNRSQEAMIAHEVSTTTRSARGRWQSWRGCWQRREETKGKDELLLYLPLAQTTKRRKKRKRRLTEGEKEEEEEAGVTRACGNNGEDPKRATLSLNMKNKKKKNRKKD